MFAKALDAGDWAGVEALVARGCTYRIRGDTVVGAEPIVGSYRRIAEWVDSTFDAVRYESEVKPHDGDRARIRFRDLIDHGPHHLDFRCEQLIAVDGSGAIIDIEHVDIPGEPEKAAAFNRACGVAKPG